MLRGCMSGGALGDNTVVGQGRKGAGPGFKKRLSYNLVAVVLHLDQAQRLRYAAGSLQLEQRLRSGADTNLYDVVSHLGEIAREQRALLQQVVW